MQYIITKLAIKQHCENLCSRELNKLLCRSWASSAEKFDKFTRELFQKDASISSSGLHTCHKKQQQHTNVFSFLHIEDECLVVLQCQKKIKQNARSVELYVPSSSRRPQESPNRKDDKSVPRYRVKLLCRLRSILSHYYRSPWILCNDENFIGFLLAREEHNASFISNMVRKFLRRGCLITFRFAKI